MTDKLRGLIGTLAERHSLSPVSYTHLDVYKRQHLMEDSAIIELYWARDEGAITQTDAKYLSLIHI